MPIPDFQSMMRPVLQAFAEGHSSVKDILPVLKELYAVTPEEAEERIPSGKAKLFDNRVHWARTYLGKAGLLRSVRRGQHEITDLGRQALKDHPEKLNIPTLKSYQKFTDWQDTAFASEKKAAQPLPEVEHATPAETPDAILRSAHAEITAATEDEVLQSVLRLSPQRFEQLVVDLLVAMGYGGGDVDAGQVTQYSADGGIDGVIREDALGLDAIYIQAKRYQPGNTVGRPAIQGFIGSMTGENASKGVFVTTSEFSSGAREFAGRVSQRVILIDGARLARLMIRHRVGLRVTETFEICEIDANYFVED